MLKAAGLSVAIRFPRSRRKSKTRQGKFCGGGVKYVTPRTLEFHSQHRSFS